MATTPAALPPAMPTATPAATPSGTTSAVPGGGSSGGGGTIDYYGKLGEALRTPSGPSQTDKEPERQTQPEQVQEPSPEAVTEPESTPEGQEPQLQADQQQVQQTDDPFAEYDEVDKPTLDAILKDPRGQRIYAGYKFTRELLKPTDQGGIGHIPTLEQARQYFFSHADKTRMEQDFIRGASGDPNSMAQWASYFFGPQQGNEQGNAARAAAAGHFMRTLSKVNPDAYVEAATPMMETYVSDLWERYNSASDPRVKEALWNAAQMVHKDLYGNWRTNVAGPAPGGQSGAAGQPVAAGGDPLAEREAQLQAGFRELMQRQQAQESQRQQAVERHIVTQSMAALQGEVEKAIGTALKDQKEKAPKVFNALVRDFINEVKTGMSADREVWGLFLSAAQEAQRIGTPDVIQALVDRYLTLARPVIAAKRHAFLKDAGVAIMEQSNGRHEQLRQVSSHRGPTNGAPVQQSIVPPAKWDPKTESFEAYSARRMAAALK